MTRNVAQNTWPSLHVREGLGTRLACSMEKLKRESRVSFLTWGWRIDRWPNNHTGTKTDKVVQEQIRSLHAQKVHGNVQVVARDFLPLAQHPRNVFTAVIYYYSYGGFASWCHRMCHDRVTTVNFRYFPFFHPRLEGKRIVGSTLISETQAPWSLRIHILPNAATSRRSPIDFHVSRSVRLKR